MTGKSRWDNRGMFEHYLYDYFKKNNMHETAEIFRSETNMKINPETPPGVDIQDGFLREWWHVFYDIFKPRYPITAQYNEGSSSMVNQVMNKGLQSDPSSSRERELNEEMIKELTVGSDVGIIIGGNLVPSTGSPSIKNEQISEDSTSAKLQKKEPTPSELSGDLGDIVAPETENIAPNESEAKMKNSLDSEEESSVIQLVRYSSSEASSPISSPFDGNEDKGGASSIEVSTLCTSVDSDDSNGSNAPTVEESAKKR